MAEIDDDMCPKCGKRKPGEIERRYSFGYYAGTFCLQCCGRYRDNCGEGQPQGRAEDLDEFARGGYAAVEGE